MNFHQFEKGSLGWHGILAKAFETKKKKKQIFPLETEINVSQRHYM